MGRGGIIANMVTFQKLLNRKMNRREFLLSLGVITLAVTGISGILKTLKDPNLLGYKSIKSKQGFGSGPYGGNN